MSGKRIATLSADGGGKFHRMQQDAHIDDLPDLHEGVDEVVDEEDEMSLQVNLNDRIGQRDGGTAISERPEESSRNSTPPGTVGGDVHDIRSEQHTTGAALHRLTQGGGAKLTRFVQELGDHSSAEDSARATKSAQTKLTVVANVSAPIPLKE